MTDDAVDKIIVAWVLKSRRLTVKSIQTELFLTMNAAASRATIQNRLHAARYYRRVARHNPIMSEVNVEKRLAYARGFDGPCMKVWRRTLFTDESPFYLTGSGPRVHMWRKPHEKFPPETIVPASKKGAGCVLVWGGFSYNGVDPLALCERSVNGDYYREILSAAIPECRETLELPSDFFLLQDGAPSHTAKKNLELLDEMGVETLDHPPQSPELNPIENLWAHVGFELSKCRATSLPNLEVKIKQIWSEIPLEFLRKLVDSMPRRIKAVKAAEGLPTKY